MNTNHKTMQTISKSLSDFIDAGLSHCENDIDKLMLLTTLALHVDRRSKEICGEQECQPAKKPKEKREKLKKAMQKN